MVKEKSINPAQAQRKAEKAKAIKKGPLSPLLYPLNPHPLQSHPSNSYTLP